MTTTMASSKSRLAHLAAWPLISTFLVACPRAPPPVATGDIGGIRGIIYLGPEQQSFQECGAPRAERMWLAFGTAERSDDVHKILNAQPECNINTMPCNLQEVYVELDATISAPGKYGHLGKYKREITPRRFTFAARNPPDECLLPEP